MSPLGCNQGRDTTPERVLRELEVLTSVGDGSTHPDLTATVDLESSSGSTPRTGSTNPLIQRPNSEGTNTAVKAHDDDPHHRWFDAALLPRDVWEVQYLRNTPIGYVHRRVERANSTDNHSFRIEAESHMHVTIDGTDRDQVTRLTTLERDNGELVNIDGSVEHDNVKRDFTGIVTSSGLRVSSSSNGQVFMIPLEEGVRGPFAIDQSLLRKPMHPGEVRKVKFYDPGLNAVVEAILQAGEYFQTPIMTGAAPELLEIRCTIALPTQSIESLLWTDEQGETLKSFQSRSGVRTFRTDRESARLIGSIADLDRFGTLEIPLVGDTSLLTSADETKYRVVNRNQDPFRFFSNRVNQRTRSLNAQSVQVVVRRSAEASQETLGIKSDSNADESALKKSTLIDFADTQVADLARIFLEASRIAPDAGPREKGQVLAKALSDWLPVTPFDRRILPPSQTVRARAGDSIEHALLLTALCRANHIPARVAFGMAWNRSTTEPKMRFHAWVEAHDGKQWFALDSTQPEFPLHTDHIKMVESTFTTNNPYDVINPVVEVMMQSQVEIVAP